DYYYHFPATSPVSFDILENTWRGDVAEKEPSTRTATNGRLSARSYARVITYIIFANIFKFGRVKKEIINS
ncbi:MAG: hypothetical protein ABI685_12810, partial [Ferruginibacter sp.]